MNTDWANDIALHCNFTSGEKPFKCDQCDFACIQSFDLVKHKFTHSGDKPYKCDMCPKQFTRPARLRDHMRTHTGEKPFICDVCGKGFAIQTGLKSHQASGIDSHESGRNRGSETLASHYFYSCFLPPSVGVPASFFYFYCKMLPNIAKFFSFSPGSCHFGNPVSCPFPSSLPYPSLTPMGSHPPVPLHMKESLRL